MLWHAGGNRDGAACGTASRRARHPLRRSCHPGPLSLIHVLDAEPAKLCYLSRIFDCRECKAWDSEANL